jgi:hypothetical protein
MKREWEGAAHRGSIDELDGLLASGADIDARDRHGQTALMIAAVKGFGEVVGWLIEHGATLDHKGKYGLTALMLAVINGHVDVVRKLADAGANVNLRGTGSPGFAEKTALELATELNHAGMVEILRAAVERSRNPHFETAASWTAAQAMLTFQPLQPRNTMGLHLRSIRIHVRDHKLRELATSDRTLEAHYGGFVLSEARKGVDEARRLALAVPYGPAGSAARIAGRAAHIYELGPEPEPGDIDGRNPAVVAWHDGEMFFLIASGEMSVDKLVIIADSLYD